MIETECVSFACPPAHRAPRLMRLDVNAEIDELTLEDWELTRHNWGTRIEPDV